MHAKGFWQDFELKNLGEYHDSYVQGITLLLEKIFKNFRNMCLKLYQLGSVHFASAPELVRQAALKNKKVKFWLLTDIGMLLMAEQGILDGTC